MRTVLARPWILVASFMAIVVLSFASYKLLGSDLLPEMDEGGFILDYFTPPGSSLPNPTRFFCGSKRSCGPRPKWRPPRAAPVCSLDSRQ